MAMELKGFCDHYASKINEEIRNKFEEYFLGEHLSKQIHGQIDGYSRKLYYCVIKDILNKHSDIVGEYVNSITGIKGDHQANFTTIWAIRHLFERGILSIQEDRNIEVLAENEDTIDYFLAISNTILKENDENDLAFLDQVEFSGCSKETEESQQLFRKIDEYCDRIYQSHYSEKDLEEFVGFLANKNFIKFRVPAKALKEKLRDAIKITLRSLRESLKMNIPKCTDILIKQVFGQNLLFEILAFTKFIKFGFPVLPKCRIRWRKYEYIFEDVIEFDMLVLIEELEYKPILLVEVTTRSTFENLKEKIERIQEAHQLLKEEFSSEIFIPLFIGCKESIEHVKKITSTINDGIDERQPILILFDFDEFFSHEIDKKRFLKELKGRCEVKLI